ncbi:MAG: hypothetical protein K8S87_02865 [Planctomycetes bacterium]|nr:hypothetical protein [Planctomycetota bacterium]
MKVIFKMLFMALIITIITVSPVYGQFFPNKQDIDKTEKETETAEKKEIEAQKKSELSKKKKEENAKIWKKYTEIRHEYRKKYLKSANTGDVPKVLSILEKVDANYYRATIYFMLEQWSKVKSELVKIFGNKKSPKNANGEAMVMYIYMRIVDIFDGEKWDTKIAKKIDKEIKSLLKSYLPAEERKTFIEFNDERAMRLGEIKGWMNSFDTKIAKFIDLTEKIKENPRDPSNIWKMYYLLKDEFHLHLKAQEWIEVLLQEFKDDPLVILGYAELYRNQNTGFVGEISESIKNIAAIRSELDTRLVKISVKRGEIAKKISDNKLSRKDLSAIELRYIDFNARELGRSRDRIKKLIQQTSVKFKEYMRLIERWKNGKR